MGYMIDIALGRNVIVEPHEKSTVLKAEETATVFKIISIPETTEVKSIYKKDEKDEYKMITETDFLHTKCNFEVNDLIIVEPNSVQKAVMGDKDVYYVKDIDILAKVKVG